MARAVLGVIGGSGVYDLPGIEDVEEKRIESPWGEPSDALRIGRIGRTEVVFLPATGAATDSRRRTSTTAPISTS